jgi:aromatic-L-amino-acid decarboxylase
MDDPAALELSAADMHAMGSLVLERVIAHITSLGAQPARGDLAGVEEAARALVEPPPEHGTDLPRLLEPLFAEWVPRSFNSAGPGYLAYIPGGGLFPAALADLIADSVNRYTGVWNAAPLLVQLEANALDWIRQWMEFPAEARGLVTSGGSFANFGAIVTARETLLGSSLRDGVLYVSTHTHHSVAKAASLAGVLVDRVRSIAVDDRFRLSVDALRRQIADDRAAGLKPFLVVSTAGTTNTGVIDPLEAIADVCAAEGLWHHVDAAYGGFFYLCPELRPRLAGLSRADSLALDPHKGLFLPFGTGALLVRDGEALRRAHGGALPSYLPTSPTAEFYNPCEYGPELSRPYRGLGLWLCLKHFGIERFRRALSEKHVLAREAAAELAALDGLRVIEPPPLSLFAFHVTRPGATPSQENAATRTLVERVNARGRVFLSGAEVGGRFLARVCVLCFRTREEHVAACVDDISAETAKLGV